MELSEKRNSCRPRPSSLRVRFTCNSPRRASFAVAPRIVSSSGLRTTRRVGQAAVIEVRVAANPQPKFSWKYDDKKLINLQDDGTFRISFSKAVKADDGVYVSRLLISPLNETDCNKTVTVVASNNFNNVTYTMPIGECEAESHGIPWIITGALFALCILLAIMLVYNKFKSKYDCLRLPPSLPPRPNEPPAENIYEEIAYSDILELRQCASTSGAEKRQVVASSCLEENIAYIGPVVGET